MQCRTCGYSLWNLTARVCPECGTAFRPSEFEFAPHSTRFCCPHCDHPYYGTSESGLVEPTEFACLKCGRRVHVDEMVLRPGLGVEERQTSRHPMPWLERAELGRVKAWFMMIGRALTAPRSLGRALPEEASAFRAWVYALGTTLVFVAVGSAAPVLFYGLVAGGRGIGRLGIAPLSTLAYVLAWIGGTAAGIGAALWIWAGVAHLLLLITGGAPRGFRRTATAVFYAAGAGIFCAAPCAGFLFGWIWWAISAAIMLRQTQPVHPARAAVSAASVPTLMGLGLIGLYVFPMFLMSARGPMAAPSAAAPNGSTYAIMYTLLNYSSSRNGAAPEHAAEMLLGGQLFMTPAGGMLAPTGREFLEPGTRTTLDDVRLAHMTLADLMKAPRATQLAEVSRLLESLPTGIVAHRFGDFVFTYHGAALNMWDAQLWVVVMIPDPAVNPKPAPDDPVFIGTAGYQVTETTFGELAELTEKQNQHRATLGLAPLPDLTTVTKDKPAVAPAPARR